MLKVAVIITVLEGDDSSSGCIEECRKQIDIVASEGKYSFSVYLNAEGTAGYQTAFDKASAESPDFYFFLNNDLNIKEGVLASFLENSEFLRHKAIITGTVCGVSEKQPLFGGRSRRGKLLDPDPIIPVPCHLYDMAMTFVPSYVFAALESCSDIFRQGFFDYGCGAKAAKAGIPRVIAPGITAETSRKIEIPVWEDPSSPWAVRIKSLLLSGNHELLRVIHSLFR